MFKPLYEELEKWSDAGKSADFWWRDDDVQKASEQLDKLLEISDRHQAAISLAAIPDGIAVSLAEKLIAHRGVSILQHGFSHRNYAPASERKMELGWHRPDEQIMTQIRSGKTCLQALFGKQFVPVMVPPWNRIDRRVVERLPEQGLHGLSTLGPRNSCPVSGLKQINVHLDIIDWKNGRRFAGEEACLEQLIAHLSAKREGRADPGEPTGIMSHHLVHDAGCWKFLDDLFGFLAAQPTARVLAGHSIF